MVVGLVAEERRLDVEDGRLRERSAVGSFAILSGFGVGWSRWSLFCEILR